MSNIPMRNSYGIRNKYSSNFIVDQIIQQKIKEIENITYIIPRTESKQKMNEVIIINSIKSITYELFY
jgi:hypothetical protein